MLAEAVLALTLAEAVLALMLAVAVLALKWRSPRRNPRNCPE